MEMNMMTVKQFSERTGLAVKVTRRLISEDRIVYVRAGRQYYIDYLSSMEKLFGL